MKKNQKARKAIWKWWGIIDEYIFTHIVYWLLDWVKLRIRPEIIALSNLLLVIWIWYMLSLWDYTLWIFAGVIYLFYSLWDILDWAMARYWGMTSKYWMYLDSVVDVLSETIILISLWYHFWISLFDLLAFLPLFVSYTLLKEKYIFQKKEKQINLMHYLPIKFNDMKKACLTIILICTRNDFRKIVVLVSISTQQYIIALVYFFLLYIAAFSKSIYTMITTK